MNRYRSVNQSSGLVPSRNRYSKDATPRSGVLSSRHSAALIPSPSSTSSNSRVTTRPMFSESELEKVKNGRSRYSAPFINEMTGKPVLLPPGRSIPKLKMTDLTSSLVPFVEGRNNEGERVPYSLTDKRVAEAMKEVIGSSDDMLKSFDEVVRIPDVRVVNSKIQQIRKGLAPLPDFQSMSTSRLDNAPSMQSSRRVQSTVRLGRRPDMARVSPKNEEETIRNLMDKLKDKYLNDMESQLGLAVQRKSNLPVAGTAHGGKAKASKIESGVPRPSTSATEIALTIDKVVRDWAKESQKISTANSMKNLTAAIMTPSRSRFPSGRQNKLNELQLESRRNTENATAKGKHELRRMDGNVNQALPSFNAPERNKNLQTISSAFRKMLDPISKQNVDELINIPDDDVVDREHEERKKAHESIFKNVVVAESGDGKNLKASRHKKRGDKRIKEIAVDK